MNFLVKKKIFFSWSGYDHSILEDEDTSLSRNVGKQRHVLEGRMYQLHRCENPKTGTGCVYGASGTLQGAWTEPIKPVSRFSRSFVVRHCSGVG